MEQAAALPFATRHLADLGAEVIRIQSHARGAPLLQDIHYFRNKKSVGLDLSKAGGPDVFRAIAANVDVVAHNFTPRVMRQFKIDFDQISQVNDNVIYCSVTGFGTTGPWKDRPLFGPGAEAMSGQNSMIGEPGSNTPGRPGTITYADHVCGLYLLVALLGALDERRERPGPRHVEVSLYETGVSHIGTVVAERSKRANRPAPSASVNIETADVADVVRDHDRWSRGCFVVAGTQVTSGPVWGGGVDSVWTATTIGEHNEEILKEIARYESTAIENLAHDGVVGQKQLRFGIKPDPDPPLAIERGLLSRVDQRERNWGHFESIEVKTPWSRRKKLRRSPGRRVLEVAGSVAVAAAAKQFVDLGWDVTRVGNRSTEYRWGDSNGGGDAFLDHGKRIVDDSFEGLVRSSDIVIGDASIADVEGPSVVAVISGFGMDGPRNWDEDSLQAKSGFMSVTGEYDQPPQRLPPWAAEMTGGVAAASLIIAAYMESRSERYGYLIDFVISDVLTGFVQSQVGRYAATGEVARREGRVKHALRMVPTRDGHLYCAPGAVMNVPMEGVAKLTGEPRLAEVHFQTAEGRMQNWSEYSELMVNAFSSRSAKEWFAEAENHHLTFALVQSVDDLYECPQLHARGTLVESRGYRFPISGFRIHRADANA
tara:strand:- start:828 stop:2792 length:1965 start_codon:yes stop_codon:yes gene_type:complete